MAQVVVIGAGLAGSLVASRLAGRHRVTVIERASRNTPLPVLDRGRPAGLDEHAGCGPGGSSYLWHNGLIQLEDEDFSGWPIAAADLAPYLGAAYRALSGVDVESVREVEAELRSGFTEVGVAPHLTGRSIYYPSHRRNLWKSEDVARKPVARVIGRVERILLDDGGRAGAAFLAGGSEPVKGDVFVLAAGGLGSPQVLATSGLAPLAGRFYHDHPVGFVAEVTLKADINRIWNRYDRRIKGSLRLPLVIRGPDHKFAFYFRPAGPTALKAKSVLSELRNKPFDPRLYVRLLAHSNDIVEAISLKAGINIPTRRFVLYMCAEQAPQDNIAVAAEGETITRDWVLDEGFRAAANDAIARVLAELAPVVERANIIPSWFDDLATAAHHSGTCRMAASAAAGVCDAEARVFGTRNLYVCDGSLIPAAGYANTGLTIGALALRLTEMLDA
jgi:choline dehydrogenase-like flavoprotein